MNDECTHDYNMINFIDCDARTEWTDKCGPCECGATVTYRLHIDPHGNIMAEMTDVEL